MIWHQSSGKESHMNQKQGHWRFEIGKNWILIKSMKKLSQQKYHKLQIKVYCLKELNSKNTEKGDRKRLHFWKGILLLESFFSQDLSFHRGRLADELKEWLNIDHFMLISLNTLGCWYPTLSLYLKNKIFLGTHYTSYFNCAMRDDISLTAFFLCYLFLAPN